MGVRFLGIGRQKARSDRRRRTADKAFNRSLEGYNDILGTLRRRMQDANMRSGMSVRDLYGGSIDRMTDNIRSNANATKSALSRLGNARGDDPTGGLNVSMGRADERANRSIGDVWRFYTDRAQTDREQADARGDRLANLQLGGRGNLLNLWNDRYREAVMQEMQRRQANKQFGLDVFSTLTNTATSMIPGIDGGGG